MRRHDRVVAHHVDAFAHCLLGVAETREPLVEVDAAMVRHPDVVSAHAKAHHVGNHALSAHVLRAAVRVRDDHDVLDAELAHGDEQRSHDAAEGMGNLGTCNFDDFRVAVLKPERRHEQRCQTRVHARDHGELLVGVLVRLELLVFTFFHEVRIVFQNLIDRRFLGHVPPFLLMGDSLASSSPRVRPFARMRYDGAN